MRSDDNLLLFPGCDARGWVSDALTGGSWRYREHSADNVFFAWLLELPEGVDSKAAASTLLRLARVAGPEDPFRQRLTVLLQDLVADRSQSRAETVDELIERVLQQENNEGGNT